MQDVKTCSGMVKRLNDNEVREVADMQSKLNAYECFITALWMRSLGKENINYPLFERTPCEELMHKLWKWVGEHVKKEGE